MANSKRSTGARPWGNPLRVSQYVANAAIYPGDFVQQGSSGNVVVYASSANPILGVASSYAAGQGSPVLVWDHPDQQFVINSDGSQPSLQSDVFKNYQITATAGSASYKVSRMALTGTSQGTVATMPLKGLFVDTRPDSGLGTYADIVVLINNHVFKGGTGAVGV